MKNIKRSLFSKHFNQIRIKGEPPKKMNLTQYKGKKGELGESGRNGDNSPSGPKGDYGEKGMIGRRGSPGLPGLPGTITKGPPGTMGRRK